MQQTNKYKLNLIESSDPFLPDGLNANTQKVEDAMVAHEAKVDGAVADLDQRVTTLELHKFAYGIYMGTGHYESQIIELGFHPHAVLVYETTATRQSVLLTENTAHSENRGVSLVENGFRVAGDFNNSYNFYIAFA